MPLEILIEDMSHKCDRVRYSFDIASKEPEQYVWYDFINYVRNFMAIDINDIENELKTILLLFKQSPALLKTKAIKFIKEALDILDSAEKVDNSSLTSEEIETIKRAKIHLHNIEKVFISQ